MKLTYIFGARLKAQYFHIFVEMKSIEPKWKAFNHNYLMPKIYGLDQSMILTKIEVHVDVSFFVPFLRNVSWYFVYYNFDTCIKNCIKVISIHKTNKNVKRYQIITCKISTSNALFYHKHNLMWFSFFRLINRYYGNV